MLCCTDDFGRRQQNDCGGPCKKLCCCCVVVCCVALMIFGRRQEKDCGGPCKKAETALGRDQKDRSATSKIARLVLLLTRAKIWKCIQNKVKENKSANIRSV